MTATNQPDRSPAPGIIPETVRVHDDNAPTAATAQHKPTLKRRNPVRLVAAKVIGAVRGDKYMADAYPAAERDAAAPLGDAGTKAKER